jgi:hypothetical protein
MTGWVAAAGRMDIFASIDGAFFYERYGAGFHRRQNREQWLRG